MVFSAIGLTALMLARQELDQRLRLGLLVATVLLVGNVLLVTTGRSGYLALLVCAACLAVAEILARGFNRKSLAGAGLSLVAVVMALALLPGPRTQIAQAVHEMTHYQESQVETRAGQRVIFWKNTLGVIAQSPIIGHGTGAFGTAYGKYVAGKQGLEAMPSSDPHNQYLKIAAEHGLLGLLVFLSILAMALRQKIAPPWRFLGLATMAAWCATSMANSHFSTFTEGTFIYVWLGVMLAQARPEHRS